MIDVRRVRVPETRGSSRFKLFARSKFDILRGKPPKPAFSPAPLRMTTFGGIVCYMFSPPTSTHLQNLSKSSTGFGFSGGKKFVEAGIEV
jgi:hypothetical protein